MNEEHIHYSTIVLIYKGFGEYFKVVKICYWKGCKKRRENESELTDALRFAILKAIQFTTMQ